MPVRSVRVMVETWPALSPGWSSSMSQVGQAQVIPQSGRASTGHTSVRLGKHRPHLSQVGQAQATPQTGRASTGHTSVR